MFSSGAFFTLPAFVSSRRWPSLPRVCLFPCAQILRAHAAAVLRKEPEELTAREEGRMAYAIGDGVYTISRLCVHLNALLAGLPTE